MNVGGVGGAGGAANAGGSVSAGSGAAAVGGAEATPAVNTGSSSSGGDTKAAEMGAADFSSGAYGPQMSTQDWCSLRTQAATPTEESPEMDLQKMLQWLMAIKLMEAMNKEG